LSDRAARAVPAPPAPAAQRASWPAGSGCCTMLPARSALSSRTAV